LPFCFTPNIISTGKELRYSCFADEEKRSSFISWRESLPAAAKATAEKA